MNRLFASWKLTAAGTLSLALFVLIAWRSGWHPWSYRDLSDKSVAIAQHLSLPRYEYADVVWLDDNRIALLYDSNEGLPMWRDSVMIVSVQVPAVRLLCEQHLTA